MKLVQLNIEKSRHLKRVIPFLKEQNPDVICLQEVVQSDVALLEQSTGMRGLFAPIVFALTEKTLQGNLILTKHTFEHATIVPYCQTEMHDAAYNMVVASVLIADESFEICCTHFVWTSDGEIDDAQRNAWKVLKPILEAKEEFVFAGDFNAPRGNEMHSLFTQIMTDNLPEHVETTLDPTFHRKPHLRLAVDSIFSKKYMVSNVQVIDGISDHMALVADVTRVN